VTASPGGAKIAAITREGDPADAALGTPKPPPPAAAGASAAAGPLPPGTVRVPDATGMPAHDVLAALTKAGLVPQIEGWGRVVRQSPAGGAAAPKGSPVRVVLEPAS
jgi:hypothetical protein